MQPRHAEKPKDPEPTEGQSIRLSWRDILGEWNSIELDLQDWGIDPESGIFRERSWRWLHTRIVGLIGNPESRLRKSLEIPATHSLN